MASKKLTWLLILQGWTMLWVVIGHAPLTPVTIQGSNELDITIHNIAKFLFSIAYSFHMPLFIMISGYLFYRTRITKGWKYLEMVKEKWIRLGIPYIVFITLAILLKICMPGSVDRSVDTNAIGIIMNYLAPFNGALQEMWFVAVIMIYFLLYPIYPLLLKSKNSILITIALSIAMFFIPVGTMTDFFAINRAVHFFLFFFIGITISRLKLEQTISSWYAIGISSAIYCISYILKLDPLTSLCGSLAFWGLAIIVDGHLSNNIFHSFRNYTYQIFLIGIFAQIAIKIVYGKVQNEGYYLIFWIACILAGIYVPVIIAKIAERTNNSFLKKLLGL